MGTVIVGAIVFAVIGLAAYSALQTKRKGGCGCGCSGCDQAKPGKCHK